MNFPLTWLLLQVQKWPVELQRYAPTKVDKFLLTSGRFLISAIKTGSVCKKSRNFAITIPDICWALSACGPMISLSCSWFFNRVCWQGSQRWMLFRIFNDYWNDSLLYIQGLKINELWWSNRLHSNSKKQLHWKYPVEKGNSDKFCKNLFNP